MYALMGANGNITSKLAKSLCSQGKKVRVIGRSAERMRSLQDAGAELAIGSVADAAFLANAFQGAEAVYTMIPPEYSSPDHRKYQNNVGEAVAQAITRAGVNTVVSLSSIGGPLPAGTGLIVGLHDQEERLKRLNAVHVLHLRPAYFMENHLHSVGLIKSLGVYLGMIAADVPIHMIATRDIADHAAAELIRPTFKGQEARHLTGSRPYTMSEAASILGAALGKPELKYVKADSAQVKAGMVQTGFSQNVADLFEEMSNALSDGTIMQSIRTDAVIKMPTTLEQFAAVLATAASGPGVH